MTALMSLLALGALVAAVAALMQLSTLGAKLRQAEQWIGYLIQELGQARAAFRDLQQRQARLEQWAMRESERAARGELPAAERAAGPAPAAAVREAKPSEVVEAEAAKVVTADESLQPSLPFGEAAPVATATAEAAGQTAAAETGAQNAAAEAAAHGPGARRQLLETVHAAGQPAAPGPAMAGGVAPAAAPAAPVGRQPQPPAVMPLGIEAQAAGGGAEMGLEQWLGVRGAAVLGAALLALAAAYFFKYSIDHDLISPTTRFAAGTLAGIGCVAGAEFAIRRRHALLAHCVAGAGFAILYLSFWAGWARYGLIGTTFTAILMVVVTGACCALAAKRASRAIAIYGLVGGFATPLLLSTGADRPIILFSYLLLLDLALLFLAHRGRWPWLGLLSLLATAGYEAAWTGARMGPTELGLGLGIVLTFTLVFVATPRPAQAKVDATGQPLPFAIDGWTATQATAVLLPFLFAWYVGANAELSPALLPTAALATTLVIGACWLARREGTMWLETGAVGGALGVLGAVLAGRGVGNEVCWPTMAFVVGIAAVLQCVREVDHRHLRAGRTSALAASPALAAWILGSLAITLLAVSLGHASTPWPWLCGWVALAAVALRRGMLADEPLLLLGSAAMLGLCLRVLFALAPPSGTAGAEPALLPAVLLCPLAMALGSLALRPPASRRFAAHGSALLALMALTAVPQGVGLDAPHVLLGVLALLLVVCATVARTGAVGWLLAAAPIAATALSTCALADVEAGTGGAPMIHAGQALAAALLVGWVFVLGPKVRNNPWTYRAAALSGPVFLPTGLLVHHRLYGDDTLVAVPVGLGLIALAAAVAVRRRRPSDERALRHAKLWLWSSFWGLSVLAVPIQWSNEWITIGWALEGVLLLVLWRRFDYAGLKYLGFALLAIVTFRLVANPWVLGYHDRGELRLLNWLSWTYLTPAACLLGAGHALRGLEVARRRRWERELGRSPVLALVLAGCAIVVLFVWLNLTIVDWYATGPSLELELEHVPARDLTMSIGWAIYGLALLAIGMVRSSRALRSASLVLILATCAKVFLYDLSHLADLYRVFSLVGLALSLIAISFAYKRFVFRDEPGAAAAPAAAAPPAPAPASTPTDPDAEKEEP